MQSAAYKKNIEKLFDKVSYGYDTSELSFFDSSALHLIEYLNLKESDHLLDLATGSGHVVFNAADIIKTGHMTAIDCSSGMIEKANKKKNRRHLKNITFLKCDIEQMPFPPGYFDVVICAFGLFFLQDMQKGLKKITNVVKQDGVLAISTFTHSFFEPLKTVFLNMIKEYNITLHPLSWERLSSKDQIRELLGSAGYGNIHITQKQVGYYIKDSHAWWTVLWNLGYRSLLEQLSDNDLLKFKAQHLKEIAKYAGPKGIWLDVEVLLAKGSRKK